MEQVTTSAGCSVAGLTSLGKVGVMEIVTSWMEEGVQKGLQQEAQLLVLRLLRKRLGGLDEATETRIQAMSTEQLEELGEALLDFSGPDDFAVWLQEHSDGI
jgi:hypothetical protein